MIGNGTMTLGGAVKPARMTLSGAGALDAGALAVGELISDSDGAADHILHAVKSAAVTARGIGKTVVLGRQVSTVRNVELGSVTCAAGTQGTVGGLPESGGGCMRCTPAGGGGNPGGWWRGPGGVEIGRGAVGGGACKV